MSDDAIDQTYEPTAMIYTQDVTPRKEKEIALRVGWADAAAASWVVIVDAMTVEAVETGKETRYGRSLRYVLTKEQARTLAHALLDAARSCE